MIQVQTLLNISDNSGGKIGKCIKIIQGYKNRYGKINNLILVTIQKLRKKRKNISKVKKGNILKSILIRTKNKIQKKDGTFIKFKENSIILINKDFKPIGTKIYGPVSKKLKSEKYMKIASISTGFF